MSHTIHCGDSAVILKQYPDNHFDSIITDPPYGIAFLGKDWDSFRATKVSKSQRVQNLGTGMRMTTHRENLNYQEWCEQWARECLRVLKPGGWLLAFSAARLYHRIAAGIEDAGFEVRDQIMWIYASGFPKAQDMGKAIQRRQGVEQTKKLEMGKPGCATRKSYQGQTGFSSTNQETIIPTSAEALKWPGWKTALKPGHEPIVMARKPFKGSTIDNIQQHGVGALNIDATRIPFEDEKTKEQYAKQRKANANQPPNPRKTLMGSFATKAGQEVEDKYIEPAISEIGHFPSNVLGEIPDYQKYFYCPKVSRRERHCGFEQIPDPLQNYSQGDVKNHPLWDPSIGTNLQRLKHKIMEHDKTLGQAHEVQGAVGNNHPTVKPVALMRYLIQLVTPANSTVLDPFCGSGSTGMAVCELGHEFVGCDLDPHYVAIATRRIEGWLRRHTDPENTVQHTQFEEWFETQ